jgi:uncharacterized membrane protein
MTAPPYPAALLLSVLLWPRSSDALSVAALNRPRAVSFAPDRPRAPAIHKVLHPLSSPPRSQPPVTMSMSMDGTLGLTSWAIVLCYQAWAKRFTAKWASREAEARAVWARYILEKGDYILGVQTLRNALTSASFFATACFTTLSLVVGIAAQQANLSVLSLVKYGSTCMLLILTALSYLQSVRYMNTCAFLFQVANDQRDETCSRGTVMLLMVLSQNFWAMGERMLYLLLPAFTWIFGGGAVMLPVTICFLPILYFKDLPAPTNLLKESEPSLRPYSYLVDSKSPFGWLDVFGFSDALRVAQDTVAKSGDYARDKYGLDGGGAVWPPRAA